MRGRSDAGEPTPAEPEHEQQGTEVGAVDAEGAAEPVLEAVLGVDGVVDRGDQPADPSGAVDLDGTVRDSLP